MRFVNSTDGSNYVVGRACRKWNYVCAVAFVDCFIAGLLRQCHLWYAATGVLLAFAARLGCVNATMHLQESADARRTTQCRFIRPTLHMFVVWLLVWNYSH